MRCDASRAACKYIFRDSHSCAQGEKLDRGASLQLVFTVVSLISPLQSMTFTKRKGKKYYIRSVLHIDFDHDKFACGTYARERGSNEARAWFPSLSFPKRCLFSFLASKRAEPPPLVPSTDGMHRSTWPRLSSPAADQLSKSHVRSSHSQTEEEAPVRPDHILSVLTCSQTTDRRLFKVYTSSVSPPFSSQLEEVRGPVSYVLDLLFLVVFY